MCSNSSRRRNYPLSITYGVPVGHSNKQPNQVSTMSARTEEIAAEIYGAMTELDDIRARFEDLDLTDSRRCISMVVMSGAVTMRLSDLSEAVSMLDDILSGIELTEVAA